MFYRFTVLPYLFSIFKIKTMNWKDVKGMEAYYEVSDTGLVKRKKGETIYKDGRVAHFSETILKAGLNRKGYPRVYMSVGSKKITKTIHRIVAEAWIENVEDKKTVNHIDGNKLNNHVNNLEWMTNTENMRHAFKAGVFNERDKSTIYNIKHMRDKLCKK